MKITSIVENTSCIGYPVEHGLSLYIQLNNGQNILFDMGQGTLFADNAKKKGRSISDVNIAVISHGHYDHGGGLETFLKINSKAKVYIHRQAFLPHYSLRDTGLTYIGLNQELRKNDRIMWCGDITHVSDHMMLFAGVDGNCCRPNGNRLLYESANKEAILRDGITATYHDTFRHEQSLIIEEGDNIVLLAGCAHCGIVNIINKMKFITGKKPTHILAGMHLVKSGLDELTENKFIASLAHELMKYKDCHYYTMHCTGTDQYERMKELMSNQITYLSCGEDFIL